MSIDYDEYIKSDAWRKRARAAKKRAKGRCQICYSDGELHAHHRTYQRLGEEWPTDLTVLCSDCHRLVHGRLPTPEDEEEWKLWADTFTALNVPTRHETRDPWREYRKVDWLLRTLGNEGSALSSGRRVLKRWLGL